MASAVGKAANYTLALWRKLTRFLEYPELELSNNLAEDGAGQLVYLAPTRVNLQLTEERWPDIVFRKTREH